jgi:hypothetical protein
MIDMAEKITVERLAANFADEFFSRRSDAFTDKGRQIIALGE